MSIRDTIAKKLGNAFGPQQLEVEDESARHHGHAGNTGAGETHFNVRIVSETFAGVSRLERQRQIYAVLADELRQGIHALSISALTPAEAWQEH